MADTALVDERRTRKWVRFRWFAPLFILLLALLVRWAIVSAIVYPGDRRHIGDWVNAIRQDGLFQFYGTIFHLNPWDRTYPPLSTFMFQVMAWFTSSQDIVADPTFRFLFKFIPALFEVGIVLTAYLWLRNDRTLRLGIPLLLALYPGLVVVSPGWGQYESPYVLCLVISIIALNRDKPLTAWLLFILAVMFKQPALVFGPVLLITSFRRYGWRITALGIGICIVVGVLFVAPFAAATSIEIALLPFLKVGDAFPYLSNNAYNLWYAIAYLYKGVPMPLFNAAYSDSLFIVAPLTAKTLGFILFGAYVLFTMVLAWIYARQRREFVIAAALYMGFFILPTQVHERYLYPAAVLSVFALAQDKRIWPIAAVLAVTFTYNVLAVIIPVYNDWPVVSFGVDVLAFPTALANVLILVALTGVVLFPRSRTANA